MNFKTVRYFVLPTILKSVSTTDLEWKVTYVGCAESEEHDQILEEVLVGPVPMGVNKFVLQVKS